ncbi:MAG: hypothetical protein K2N79_01735, partial [Muribaculaceae bacterium]|nr:hypothetical protein [Muribaculaceae bacterium]
FIHSLVCHLCRTIQTPETLLASDNRLVPKSIQRFQVLISRQNSVSCLSVRFQQLRPGIISYLGNLI